VAIKTMPKKSDDGAEPKPKTLASHTVKLTDAQMDKLGTWLAARGWRPFEVAYARFAFRADPIKVNVTGYQSGKVVVAGKGTEDFVRDVLEPEILGEARLGYDEVLHPDWFQAHAGLDESGKGDFFGPVVAATVVAQKSMIEAWRAAGVQDSKKIAENQILKLDELIRGTPGAVVKTRFCGMSRYNELMARPGANLNRLLAWLHASALEEALATTRVPWGLLDQFTKQPLVQRELAKKGVKDFELRMRTKAEEDPVVAAASVVARAEFVRQMHTLSKKFGAKLQKGAGPLVKQQAHELIEKLGARALGEFAKLHFRTAYEVVRDAGKLGELPLPEPKEKTDWG
jgi:ribonuclease HIII